MVEKNFQTLFTAWAKKNPPKVSTAWELKLTKGRSIRFDAVRPHQMESLLAAESTGGLFHKIADSPVSWLKGTPMRFGKPKPFDCISLVRSEAYVVILFYVPRGLKEMIFITPSAWHSEAKASSRKSLTYSRAYAISSKVITL